MTSTYVISDKLSSDFKSYCQSLGLPPAKVIRRLISYCTMYPTKAPNISGVDFLTSVAQKYGFKDL